MRLWWVERTPQGVGAARQTVRTSLEQWGVPPERREMAAVLISELVTNAVRHNPSSRAPTVWCRLRCSGTQIIVGVWDRTFRVPEQRLPPDADTTAITDLPEGGRGLVIVRALSTAWGVTDHPCGSQVWAAL